MVELFDADTGASLGTVSEQALQFLEDQLEEESLEDRDYYINQAELDNLRAAGAPGDLLTVLQTALSGREDMDIRWERPA